MANSDLTVPGAALTLTPEYSLAYNQIVRPHLRFTVTRYFAERWVPTWGLHAAHLRRLTDEQPEAGWVGPFGSAGGLAGRTAWVVVQCRQMIIWDHPAATHGKHTFSRPLALLTQESGLDKKKILEVLKEPLCQWFVRKKSGQYRYNEQTKTIGQEVNTYTVRMDDPLTPADARCLLERLAACPVTGADPLERIRQRLSWALGLDWTQPDTRAQFLAADLRAPAETRYFGEQPLEIINLVCLLELGLAVSNDPRWKDILRQCESLHHHLINPEDVIGGSYYFRKEWVKRVGHGQAWAILLLRDRCFDKTGHPVRDVCTLPSYEWLAERAGVDTKSVQRWLAPISTSNEAQADKPDTPPRFMRLMGSRKESDQRVSHSVWVAVRDPLTLDDQIRYSEALALRLAGPASPVAPGGNGQNDTPEAAEVPDKVTLQRPEGTGQSDTPEAGGSRTKRHSRRSNEQDKVTLQQARGSGQGDTGNRTKRHRGESFRESLSKQESPTESESSPHSPISSSSSETRPALKLAAHEEEEEEKNNQWEWGNLFKNTRKANPENRRKLKDVLPQIPAAAYVARYLAALADLSIGNPVGLVLANLIEQVESGEAEFEAGMPFDRLAGMGRAKVTSILHRLGTVESTPHAIAFQATDSAEEFELKEAANRYLDCFEVGTQVRQVGKYRDAALQRLRARIQRGLNELGLPDLPSTRPLETEAAEPAVGMSMDVDDSASPDVQAGSPAETSPAAELEGDGQPAQFAITASEAWERTCEKICQRENSHVSSSTSAVWKKPAGPTAPLAPARLISFVAAGKRFRVAVADQAAQARWKALALELELQLSKLTHGSCKVEIDITEQPPDQTLQAVAGQWESMSPAMIWQTTLSQLQLELSKETFNSWLRDATLVSQGPGTFVVGVKHAYAKDWLANRLRGTVQRTLSDIVGRPMEVQFTVSRG